MNERLIILTIPPATTLREQDAADLEMLAAGLKWREGADLTSPDEFGPLSGNRWHIVLSRFLSQLTHTTRNPDGAELEYLVRLLERDGTLMPGTERHWADILRRFIRGDYLVTTGRRKQEVRDRLLSRHYWLIRRVFQSLSEDACADDIARVYADAGRPLSASRIKRIAKSAQNRRAALNWIDEQVKTYAKHAPTIVERALLATFEPIAADMKVLSALFSNKVK